MNGLRAPPSLITYYPHPWVLAPVMVALCRLQGRIAIVPRRRSEGPLARYQRFSCSRPAGRLSTVSHRCRSRLPVRRNRPHNARGPSTVESVRAPRRLAWWLTVQFVPAADSILALPISRLDSTWSKATVLTREMMPPQARADPGVLAETTFGFCLNGDFNADGLRDRAAVGVYRTRAGAQGRFLLINSEISPGRCRRRSSTRCPGIPVSASLARSDRGTDLVDLYDNAITGRSWSGPILRRRQAPSGPLGGGSRTPLLTKKLVARPDPAMNCGCAFSDVARLRWRCLHSRSRPSPYPGRVPRATR